MRTISVGVKNSCKISKDISFVLPSVIIAGVVDIFSVIYFLCDLLAFAEECFFTWQYLQGFARRDFLFQQNNRVMCSLPVFAIQSMEFLLL